MTKSASKKTKVQDVAPEAQEYNLWNIPSEMWQQWLASLQVREEILAKISSLQAADLELSKEKKSALDKRLEAYNTPVTSETLKFFVS